MIYNMRVRIDLILLSVEARLSVLQISRLMWFSFGWNRITIILLPLKQQICLVHFQYTSLLLIYSFPDLLPFSIAPCIRNTDGWIIYLPMIWL